MKIIQITDTHLLPSGETIRGFDPESHLRFAVQDIMTSHRDTDLLVITGDLCNDGDLLAYALLRDILKPVRCPIRLLLGNHDNRTNFIKEFPEHPQDDNGYIQSYLDTSFARLLFLDSNQDGYIGGIYDQQRLQWLDRVLNEVPNKPIIVFIHHPPVNTDVCHFDHIGLHDQDKLMERLNQHPGGIQHIVFGHLHVDVSGNTANHISFSSGQACALKFISNDLNNPELWWTQGSPCYRVLMLDERGFRTYPIQLGQLKLSKATFCVGP